MDKQSQSEKPDTEPDRVPEGEPESPPSEPRSRGPEGEEDLDADGRERPRFLLKYPKDPELQLLVAAFERGDYQAVNQGAPALIKKTKDKRVRRAAKELVERTRPDPLMKYLLIISVLLLLYLVAVAYSQHGH